VNRTRVRVSSPTEQVNPATTDIDVVPTLELVELLNEQDALVPGAVAQVLPTLAGLVDAAAIRVSAGGRVHYFGAGTSGRLGVLDAAEWLPTFGVPAGVVVAHQAGGPAAFLQAVEDAEDDEDGHDTAAVNDADVVIGLAASGRTPYVGAALAGLSAPRQRWSRPIRTHRWPSLPITCSSRRPDRRHSPALPGSRPGRRRN